MMIHGYNSNEVFTSLQADHINKNDDRTVNAAFTGTSTISTNTDIHYIRVNSDDNDNTTDIKSQFWM